ncbi:sigma 54-interacting transcriptional regulator [Sporomusa aerivorans]|uniref:sigma-54-dependent Fis family transcriptional regulator n=1 Tax=Sporomusa aerivorans TaxID=204936 RepID=UPI00352A0F83
MSGETNELNTNNNYLLPLYETMLGLINRLEMNDLLTAIINQAAGLVATEHAYIYLVKPQENIMELILGIGSFQNFRFTVRRGEGMVGVVWDQGKPMFLNRYGDWEGRVRNPFFQVIQAALVVPLLHQEKVIGVIGLAYKEKARFFDSGQVEMLSRFAELASLVLVNAQQYNDVKQELVQREQELSKVQKMLAQAMGIARIGIFSDTMRQIIALGQKYHENRDLPVLIEGETGTGKELVAKNIHFGDRRHDSRPFVDLNCAAIPAGLFESELFGYVAGAFTGAVHKGQKGKFDLARGGTLFLDEITELPLELQSKLLRVIQEKEFFRVGGLEKIKTDVRIICATNVDLARRVEEGTFRKDLYYRLKVGHVFVPPLRMRKEEIIPLARLFLQEFSSAKRKKFCEISDEAQEILSAYDWPGNVRELRNVIEWIVALHDDRELSARHLAMLGPFRGDGTLVKQQETKVLQVDDFILPSDRFPLETFVDNIIREAVEMHGGNKTLAASYLGISRRTVYYRLEKLALRSG